MKYLLVAVAAAAIGGIVGSLVSGIGSRVEAATLARVETKELVLLDDRNQPAARLGYHNGNTVLQFYNRDTTVALEIGMDRTRPERFIHFFGKDNRILAALNTVSSGDTTLYLGDQRWQTRVIMGALLSDVITNKPTSEWGLEFRKPGSTRPMFNVIVKSGNDPTEATAGVRLLRSNGEEWSEH